MVDIMKRLEMFRGAAVAVLAVALTTALAFSLLPTAAFAVDDASSRDDAMFLENELSLTDEERDYLNEHPQVVMAADASWRPLEYLDDGQYEGVIAEIAKTIEGYTGLSIEFDVAENYSDALEAVQSGNADMISGLAADEAMAAEYDVVLTDPYLTINSAVVATKELSNLYKETEHKTIAVVADDYANYQIEQRIPNSELIECSTNEECLEKVRNGEVDMAIIASYCAEYYLGIPKYSEFSNHLMPDFNWQLSFGVSETADPALVSILNKGIARMSQVDVNECVYRGIMNAEYDNDLLEYVYKHPLVVIFTGLAIVLLIAVLLLIIFYSRKKEQRRKLQDGTRLRLALERIKICIWEFDIASGKILQIDNEHEKHGFGELREGIPESVIEKGYIHPEDVEEVRAVLARVQAGEQDVQGCWRVKEMPADSNDATYWWEQVLFRVLFDEHNRPVTAIGVSEDVTAEKNAQRDALTSLYNRSSFEQRAETILSERRNSHLQCAFLILDLDGFKQINDTYGHGTGDKVLISVGAVMAATFRSTDVVARLGGDEFTVFMTSVTRKEDVEKKAGELVDNISKIAENEGFPFAVSCSVGVAIGEREKDDLELMYKKADLALYEAKNAGKNRFMVYDSVSDAKKKVLVVDDIEMNRAILKQNLSAEYEVLEAENGVAALKVLNEIGGVALVITDIFMPEMDGIELIKRIRSDESLRDVAIIAQTQAGDTKMESDVLDLGVDDFIYKASSPGVVQMRVRNIMKSRNL